VAGRAHFLIDLEAALKRSPVEGAENAAMRPFLLGQSDMGLTGGESGTGKSKADRRRQDDLLQRAH